MSDHEALSGALLALADEQPDSPALFDLVVARRLRERRVRRQRLTAGLAAAAAVAVAVPALLWAGSARTTFSATPGTITRSPAPADALAPTTADGWFALCRKASGTATTPPPEPRLVVACQDVVEPVPGDGVWAQEVVSRATGDPTALLAWLFHPAPATPYACAAVGYVGAEQRTVVVVTAAGAVLGSWPECPGPQIVDAVNAAGFTAVARRKVQQVQTQADTDGQQAMQAAGCDADKLLDIASVGTTRPAGPPRASWLWPAGTAVHACLFTDAPGAQSAPGVPAVRYARAAPVGQTDVRGIVSALTGAAPAPACAAAPSGVAVLVPDAPGPGPGPAHTAYLVVELDGCRRVYLWSQQHQGRWQAPDSVVQSLARLLGP